MDGLWRVVPPSEEYRRSWIERASDGGEVDMAEDQHVAMGENGYMFTPAALVRGMTECPYCQELYVNAEYFAAHLAKDHNKESGRRGATARPVESEG